MSQRFVASVPDCRGSRNELSVWFGIAPLSAQIAARAMFPTTAHFGSVVNQAALPVRVSDFPSPGMTSSFDIFRVRTWLTTHPGARLPLTRTISPFKLQHLYLTGFLAQLSASGTDPVNGIPEQPEGKVTTRRCDSLVALDRDS